MIMPSRACCDEFGSEVCGCLIVERRVRPACVVVLRPFDDSLTGVTEAEEQSFAQQFVPSFCASKIATGIAGTFKTAEENCCF